MKTIQPLFFSLLFTLFLFNTQLYAQHPRVFFDKSEISALKQKGETEPYKTMLNLMRSTYTTYSISTTSGEQSTAAAFAGFLYLITDSSHYAQSAKNLVTMRINDNTVALTGWARTDVKGLTSYWQGVYVAFAYDFCYHSPLWDQAFKQLVSQKLLTMANMITTNGGTQQNTNTASNWQGIRASSAIICYLAADETFTALNFQNMLSKYDLYLTSNLGNTWTSAGWNIEGMGYNYYPFGNFIGPCAIALKRYNPRLDYRTYQSMRNTYWSIYSVLTNGMNISDFGCFHPDWGDDNPNVSGEGVYGQSYYFLTDSLKPYAKFLYDKIFSVNTVVQYENYRFGAFYNYLFYPKDMIAKQPQNVGYQQELNLDFTGNGYFTYRNQILNKDDMIGQYYVKLRGNKGHSAPDAMGFRIVGLGSAFAIGGGRYGVSVAASNGGLNDVYICNMNNLYPFDPDMKITTTSNSGTIVGTPLVKKDGSGHIISKILVNNTGVANNKRWFVTDYDSISTGANAVYLVGDEADLKSGYTTNYWQMVTYEENEISVTGTNTFLIKTPNGSEMKGTILYPSSNLRWKVGVRKRGSDFNKHSNNKFIHCQSDDGDFLVALTVVRAGKTHPNIIVSGSGYLNNKVSVGTKSYTLQNYDVLYNDLSINKAPVVIYNSDKFFGKAPLTVRFFANKSYDPENAVLSFNYSFGDGSTSSLASVTKVFTNTGSYEVKLVVSDNNGAKTEVRQLIVVEDITSLYLALPQDSGKYYNDQNCAMLANISQYDQTVTKVEFYKDNNLLGSDNSYPFQYTWNSLSAGNYNITAKAFDNSTMIAISQNVYISVLSPVEVQQVYKSLESEPTKIYPNPTQGTINISSIGESNLVEVYNTAGQIIWRGMKNQKNLNIDLSWCKKGLYFVRLTNANNVLTHKIRIE